MKLSNNPTNYEVLIKQYGRSILDADKCTTSEEINNAAIAMAFPYGQTIHIIKYEMENTNIPPKGVNMSNCINTESRILKVEKTNK